jgi:hypothetical protein
MRARQLFSALILLSLAGCASLSGRTEGRPSPEETVRELFPFPVGTGVLRGEAEVSLSLAGREVSLPAAFVFRAPEGFRLDLLDPFDRPAAVVYGDGLRLVQFRPAASAAALLRPLPDRCGNLAAGEWVAALLGTPPRVSGGGSYSRFSLWGAPRLLRYEGGVLTQRIDYRQEDGAPVPREVTWYCREEAVLRLIFRSFLDLDGRRFPREFVVTFPRARLKMEFLLEAAEFVDAVDDGLLHPDLGPGVRWKEWTLVWDD